MSGTFWVRILGMFLFGALGLWIALGVLGIAGTARLDPEAWRYVATLTLAGAGLGLLLTPYITIAPMQMLRRKIRSVAIEDIIAAVLGLIIGLIISALLSLPLSMLPSSLGQLLPFVLSVLLSYVGASTALVRKTEIYSLLFGRRGGEGGMIAAPIGILVDSSAIIDGRIADLVQTGFVSAPLIIPRFVLRELQRIADSDDPLRRGRGRRGLDVLNRLQKEAWVPVRISDLDVEDVADVDGKLVQLARIQRCPILTTDYNLNRVAELQGVVVLNLHDLARSVRPVVLPGESLTVALVHEGKEYGQGVGYLDDGTMVVVEDGKDLIGQRVTVTVTRLLPTTAGRIAFAHLLLPSVPDGDRER